MQHTSKLTCRTGTQTWRSPLVAISLSLAAISWAGPGMADEGHAHGEDDQRLQMMQEMIDEHAGHEHGHSFEALKGMTPERMREVMTAMADIGIAVPPMSSERGRALFVDKGCVVCHSVNGVGGEMGPSFNAADMPTPMNAFEFSARMWRGAPAMAELQEAMMGDVISLTGQELADIIAFAHDGNEQAELSETDIPPKYRAMMDR